MEKYLDVNEAGHSIRCKLYCNQPRGIGQLVIFCHGFGGHKDNKAAQRFAETLLSKKKDGAVLVFNWPCHGDDVKKKLSLRDCMTYLELVIAYAEEHLEPMILDAHATSFGGFMILKYISERGNPFNRIVLRCPTVDMYDTMCSKVVAPEEMEKLDRGKDVLVGFDRKVPISKAFLEELKETDLRSRDFLDFAEDILVIHGTKDEIVPIEQLLSFTDEQLIELIPVENADHRFQDYALMGSAIRDTLAFLEG